MARVGSFISDPKAGASCRMALERGGRIVLNHNEGGFKGGSLTIELVRFLGLHSERLFEFNLDSDAGKAVLAFLTRAARPHSLEATPLGAFAAYLRPCESIDEVNVHCMALQTLPSTFRG